MYCLSPVMDRFKNLAAVLHARPPLAVDGGYVIEARTLSCP